MNDSNRDITTYRRLLKSTDGMEVLSIMKEIAELAGQNDSARYKNGYLAGALASQNHALIAAHEEIARLNARIDMMLAYEQHNTIKS